MYIMALVIGCGFAAGLIYYKRNSIIRTCLEKYSDWRESKKNEEKQNIEIKYSEIPKKNLISCKLYDYFPKEFQYDRTLDKKETKGKVCKLKFKDMIFYSFLRNYDLKDTYFEYLDNIEDSKDGEIDKVIDDGHITHLNKITNCKPCLLGATATIKIKNPSMDLIPEFDILDFVNKFSFNGNSLFLTTVNKVYLLALLNKEYNLGIDMKNYLNDKINDIDDYQNFNLEIIYQLITNDAEIFTGPDVILKFDEYNALTVTTEV